MTRAEAQKIADQIVIAQVGLEDRPEAVFGIRLLAITLAPIVAERGMIDTTTFLDLCAIPRPESKKKTFRGRDLNVPLDQRFKEIMDAREAAE